MDTGLTVFPIEICSLVSLRRLSLANNELCEVPDEIQALSRLKWLSIANNKLNSILEPAIVSLSELIVCHLQSNRLSTFPLGLLKLKTLSVLDLRHNAISSVPALELISSYSLNKLDLRGNNSLDNSCSEDQSLPWRELDYIWV